MPVLKQLHWLSARQRIEFKLVVLVYKVLNSLSLQYLADDCQLFTIPPAADDFDCPTSLRARFQELAQVWVIDYSLLLDHISLEQRDSERTIL